MDTAHPNRIMQFFTRAWQSGELDEEQSKRTVRDYLRQIGRIQQKLAPDLRILATDVSLHDGLFETVRWHAPEKKLEMTVRAGDLQTGYFDAYLIYLGVTEILPDMDTFVSIVGSRDTVILYDEVDFYEPWFEHRLLLWPDQEMAIRFTDFKMVTLRAVNRDVGEGKPRFIAM